MKINNTVKHKKKNQNFDFKFYKNTQIFILALKIRSKTEKQSLGQGKLPF